MIYGSEHGKYWFSRIVYNNFTTMVSTENVIFQFIGTSYNQIHWILRPKLLYFLRKCKNVRTHVVIDLWIKTWKILIFTHFVLLLHNHGLYWNRNVIFEFLAPFRIRSIWYLVQSCFIIIYKVFKNKAQGCSTPLKECKIRPRVFCSLKVIENWVQSSCQNNITTICNSP